MFQDASSLLVESTDPSPSNSLHGSCSRMPQVCCRCQRSFVARFLSWNSQPGSLPIIFRDLLSLTLSDSLRILMMSPSKILDPLDPVRPGSISTNRSSPGSSSDLPTASRPEDSAQRLPADLPPFHYSSLMTRHALNYNGWDYDPCRLSSDGRLRVVMDPLFQRPRHGEVPIGQSKQRQGSSADFLI